MEPILETTYQYPQAVIANGSTTGNSWSNPNNILAVDNDTADSSSTQSSDITVGNFNFNLPQDAVVTGIGFKMRAAQLAVTSPLTSITFNAVTDNGTIYPYTAPFSGLTTVLDYYEFGGQTYRFDADFTPDQVNNLRLQLISNNGVLVDAVMMQIFYYIPVVTPPDAIPTDQEPGYQSVIQAGPFELSRPLGATDTKMYLESFNYPNGDLIQLADLGGGYLNLTINPGLQIEIPGTSFEENVKTAAWAQLPSGEIEVDFGTLDNRGLDFKYGYSTVVDNIVDHMKGATVIITANAPYLSTLVKKTEIDTIVSAPIEVLEEGVEVTSATHSLNFVGAGATATANGKDVTVNIPGVGGATTPVRGNVASETSGSTQVTSLSYDIDVTGTDRTAIIQISTQQSVTVTGVTIGGATCTSEVSTTDAVNNIRVEQWRRIAPALGTQTVVVTLSGPAYVTSGAEIWSSTDQTDPVGVTANATGSSLTPSVAINSALSYSVIVDALGTAITPIAITKGAGQIDNWTENTGTCQGASTYENTGTAPDAVTMSYTLTQNTPWVINAIEIKGIVITPVLTGLEVQEGGVPVESDVSVINIVGADVTNTAPNVVEINVSRPDPIFKSFSITKSVQGSNTGTGVTTRFDITNPAGTTFRYTYDGTGTDPNINSGTVSIGQVVQIQAQNFASANKGTFLVTGVGANYFEVTNVSGIVESDKTVGTGYIAWNNNYSKPAGLKYVVVELVGAGSGSGGADAPGTDTNASSAGAGGGYAKKNIPAASIGTTELVVVGVRGIGGSNTGGDGTQGTSSSFGSHCSATAGQPGMGTTSGNEAFPTSAGVGSGGDLNIPGENGGGRLGTSTAAISGGKGGSSMLGFGSLAGTAFQSPGEPTGYGSGAGSVVSVSGSGISGVRAMHGIVLVTEFF